MYAAPQAGLSFLGAVAATALLALVPAPAARGAAPSAPRCGEQRWVASWAASPSDASRHTDLTQFVDGSANLNLPLREQSVRTTLTPTLGGTSVRVRLSNRFGTAPVTFGHVAIAGRGSNGSITGPSVDLLFGGGREVIVPPGEDVLSDATAFAFAAMQPLAVSVYVRGNVGYPTRHLTARQTSFVGFDSAGDHVADAGGGAFPFRTTSRPFVSGLEVMAPTSVGSVVAFGDSITDGYAATTLATEDRSTIDRDRRYPDVLAERLRAAGRPLAVVNAGISGNRVARDTVDARGGFAYGRAAVTRFDADALAQAGVTTVIIEEGLNDLAQMPQATVAELIAGYRDLIGRAQAAGLRVIQTTIVPGGNLALGVDAARREVNDWIRTQSPADAIVDFDVAVRDPTDPSRIRPDYDSGDGLHLSESGYRTLAERIPLAELRDAVCLEPLTVRATPTRLRARRLVRIRVTVKRAGAAAAGVRVQLGRVRATTDAGGRATLRVRPAAAGLRTLRVTAPGSVPAGVRVRVLPARPAP